MVIAAIFLLKTGFFSQSNAIGQRILSLLNVSDVLIHEISWKFDKGFKVHEKLVPFDFLVVFFCVAVWPVFWIENFVYFLTRAYRILKSFLVDGFHCWRLSKQASNTKFDEICKKTLKIWPSFSLFSCSVSIGSLFSSEKAILFWKEDSWITYFSRFERFEHSKPRIYRKIDKKCIKTFKVGKFFQLFKSLTFGSILGHSGVFGSTKKAHKSLEIHIATYWMILILCWLNFLGEAL